MRYLIFAEISMLAISYILPVFGDITYGILNHRFVNQSIVCIYEPDVPQTREITTDS